MNTPDPGVNAVISPEGHFFEVESSRCHKTYSWHEEWCLKKFGTISFPKDWIRQGIWSNNEKSYLCLDFFDFPSPTQWETLTIIVLNSKQDIIFVYDKKNHLMCEFHLKDFKDSGMSLSEFTSRPNGSIHRL